MTLTPTLKMASLSVGKLFLNSAALEMLATLNRAVAVNALRTVRVNGFDSADDLNMVCSHKWVG
jgi:ribulose bisphosphate carboxylase small subunit